MGAEGPAQVDSVGPCPRPDPKPDSCCRLVTGLFRHTTADILDIADSYCQESSDDPCATASLPSSAKNSSRQRPGIYQNLRRIGFSLPISSLY